MITMYRFKRGDTYSVDVIVSNGESITYANIVKPEDTPTAVVEQLLEDAERAVLVKLNQKEGEKYVS